MKSFLPFIVVGLVCLSACQGPVRPGVESVAVATVDREYQLGDEWDKRPITGTSVKELLPALRRAAYATARAGMGTAWYLGKFNGHHLMVTNYHVFPSGCREQLLHFFLFDERVSCLNLFGTWKEIDLNIFSIDVPARFGPALTAAALKFAFREDVYPGQLLVTAGFGGAQNPRFGLMGDQGKDCKIISGRNVFRFLTDVDQENPGGYQAWSLAHGCETSHGDSGAALVDRNTGEVVGVTWTGRTPKSSTVQSSAYLDALANSPTEEVWTSLNYGVPAVKIFEIVAETVAGRHAMAINVRSLDPGYKETLRLVLEGRPDK